MHYPLHAARDGELQVSALAEVLEAMASHRPSRPSLGIDAAMKEIAHGRASAYDPALVDARTTGGLPRPYNVQFVNGVSDQCDEAQFAPAEAASSPRGAKD